MICPWKNATLNKLEKTWYDLNLVLTDQAEHRLYLAKHNSNIIWLYQQIFKLSMAVPPEDQKDYQQIAVKRSLLLIFLFIQLDKQ